MDLGIEGLEDAELLGSGGFGSVYRARQVRLHRTVAVKVLPQTGGDETAELRFQRETAALGTLATHPNIVTVYDSGLTTQGQPYLIMELVSRGSLADLVEREGPIPWARVLEIGVGLAGALASAHAAGILHRDIKPANVLLSDFDEPMLADFGIARMQGAGQTQSAAITGSAAHLAPELLHGEAPSEASDVYALGSTLFHVLAGTPAFVRSTDQTIAAAYQRILTAPVPDLRTNGVPDRICSLLEQLLSKEPGERPASAVEVGELLRELQREAGLDPTPLLVRSVDPDALPGASSTGSGSDATTTGSGLAATVDRPARTARPRPRPQDHDTGTDAEGRPRPGPSDGNRRRLVMFGGGAGAVVLIGAAALALNGGGGDGVTNDPATEPTDVVASPSASAGAATTGTDQTTAGLQELTATSSTLAGGICTAFAQPGATGGDGSPSAPFGSVADLLGALQPGDIGCLAGGTWDEPVTLGSESAGSASAPIVIGGVSGHDVVITAPWHLTEGASDIRLGDLTFVGDTSEPLLTIDAPSVQVNYLRLSNPSGPCLSISAPTPDRARQVTLSGSVLRGCGTPTAAAIVVGANSSFNANNFVVHADPSTGGGPAIAIDDADFVGVTAVTTIDHAAAISVAQGQEGLDRALSISQVLATGLTGPAVVLDAGTSTTGFLSLSQICAEPAEGITDGEVTIDPDGLPEFASLDDSVVATQPVEFQDPDDDDFALARGSGCDGYGASQTVLDILRNY